MTQHAYHGGAFFDAIGADLRHLDRASRILSADVLDAWFDPSPRVLQTLRTHLPFLLKTSPPNHAEGLVQELAIRRSLPADCILPGAGSSSLLFHCLPRLLPASPRVLLPDPMYGEYRHLITRVMDGEALAFPLVPEAGFELDVDHLAAAVLEHRPDAVALVNPNNPTGRLTSRESLERFIFQIPDSVTILVDETYIEYAGATHSMEPLAARLPNLVVLKSMSKVYALSGERVAYLVAHPQTCQRLSLYLPPWPVGLSAQAAALEALRDPAYYEAQYRETARLRCELATGLHRLPGVSVFPSDANFVLIHTAGGRALADYLRVRDVFVREFPPGQTSLSESYLRLSVKDAASNNRLLEAMREYFG